MGQIIFSTIFSGGAGNINIVSNETEPATVFQFDQTTKGDKSITLPMGNHPFSITGAAPAGAGGNITLNISGNITGTHTISFPAGRIPPHFINIHVK